MGQAVHGEWHIDIILQGFPTEYERARVASYEKRDFELDDIRNMVVNRMFVGSFKCLFN